MALPTIGVLDKDGNPQTINTLPGAGGTGVPVTLDAETAKVIGTVRAASAGIASGAIASGAIASGAFASGAVASGAFASGAVASGAFASGALASGAGADGWDSTQGVTTGAAVITDANGTLQQYLRGLVKLAITSGGHLVRASVASGGVASGAIASGAVASGAVASGAVASGAIASGAIVDGADVAEGALADSAVVTDTSGSVSGKLRGLVKMFADMWDSTDHALKIWVASKLDYVNDSVSMPISTCGVSAKIEDTNAATILGVAGALTYWKITAITVTNSDATVGTLVTIQDDTAGTPVKYWEGYCAPLGGGFALPFPSPLGGGQVNGKVNAICGTTSAEVYVSVAGYKSLVA